jgi:hypothetical protein
MPDNISLLPFPAYSPELNPMENVLEFPPRQQAFRPCLGQLRSNNRGLCLELVRQ